MARNYVAVRVTNVDRINLSDYVFDYDLTMAILLANADGTVYHRYGGRSHRSPMDMEGLVDLMEKGLVTHREYLNHPEPPEAKPPQFLPQLINEQLRGRIKPVFGCFHCHYAREAQQVLALEAGRWRPNQFWIWPLPERLGLVMDQKRQYRVGQVVPGSPADLGGIRKGDLLDRLGGRRILTKYDIQWILHQREDDAGTLAYAGRRGERQIESLLNLEEGWKVGDPEDYLWRVRNVYTEHMIKFLPAPGFIGRPLSQNERRQWDIAGDEFALMVTQLNNSAHLSGIRPGDVVTGAGYRRSFGTTRDFYAWCEAQRRAGRDLKVHLLRRGKRMNVMMGIEHLNASRVERAPRVKLGFIVQELPGDAGLRVGHVDDGCSAERVGIAWGDRMLRVDEHPVRDMESLAAIMTQKLPGDLISMDLRRGSELHQFSFVLPEEGERLSNLAVLSQPAEKEGQVLDCVVSLRLPPDKHIYSAFHEGLGQPTQLEFRGRGYRLIGGMQEPAAREWRDPSGERHRVLDGDVELRQRIEVTDAKDFYLLLHVYAQVCDDHSCHEFRAMVASDGTSRRFSEFRGRFEQHPLVPVVSGL